MSGGIRGFQKYFIFLQFSNPASIRNLWVLMASADEAEKPMGVSNSNWGFNNEKLIKNCGLAVNFLKIT